MLEKIERAVFFNITRVVAWLIILPAFLLLVLSGYRLAASYISGHKAIKIRYEEVQAEMDRSKDPWGALRSDIEGRKKEKEDIWTNEIQLQELLYILRMQVDGQKAANKPGPISLSVQGIHATAGFTLSLQKGLVLKPSFP